MRSLNFKLAALGLLDIAASAKVINVRVDSTPQQTLVAFGASGAWWPTDLIRFPLSKQQELARFLFSSDGLYLSSYRYNMGGGGGNDTTPVAKGNTRVQSFLLSNGTYDWSRDHGGVTFLKHAQAHGVPDITFFANAAPAAIATNGAACGWNLTADKIDAYAEYFDTVLSYWTSQGIDIRYLSTMNEPDDNRSSCTQEGMAVVPALRAPLVKAVREKLNTGKAKSVDVIADETSQISTQAIPEDPAWLADAAPYMSNIAVHNYDYPTDAQMAEYYQQTLNLTHGKPPPVKFTETCCSANAGHGSTVFGAQYDPTMANALIVARYVWQFLTIAQAVSFDWWTAVADLPCSPSIDGQQCATAFNASNGYNSGLVYIDPNYATTHDYSLYYTKRAFMLKQFAYFHRPGSVRYDVPQSQLPYEVNAIASKTISQNGSTWQVLFMNHANSTMHLNLTAPSNGATLTRIVQTTNEIDFGDVTPLPQTNNGKVPVQLPPQSLLTCQFSASSSYDTEDASQL